jgi:hypothetical protein
MIGLHAALGLGAYGVARFGLKQGPGWPRALAAATLAWCWLTVGLQAMGTLGLLRLAPLAAWCLAGTLAGLVARAGSRQEPGPGHQGAVSDRDGPLSVPSILALGLMTWGILVMAGPSLLRAAKVVSDGPIYHLYFAAKWWRAGKLFLVPTPFGESAATYFPAGGDIWFAWLMTVWGGPRLAQVGQAPFLLLAATAAYAIARLLGAGRSGSAIAVALFVSISPLLLFSFEANVDTIFIAGYLVSAYFFLRAGRGDDGWPCFLLAGLAAGCALGTKPTGIVFVPPLLLMGCWIARRRLTFGSFLLLMTGVFLPSAYWYGRNFWLSGNPLYPLHVEVLGRVVWPGWYTSAAMRRNVMYAIPFDDWRAALDTLLAVTDPRLLPLWLAAILGAWKAGRPSSERDRLVWWCAGVAALNFGLYWAFVPYRTQQRFFLQAYGLAVAPLALLLERSRWLPWVAVVLLGLHLLTPETWPVASVDADLPWDLSPFVPSAIPGLVPVPQRPQEWQTLRREPSRMISVGLLVALGMMAVICLGLWSRARTYRRAALAGLATVTLLGLTAFLYYPWGLDARHRFYPGFDFLPGWLAIDSLAGPSGARIAYAGTNLPYYLMGPGLRNDVRYVNVDDHPDWLMHDYHRRAITEGKAPSETPRPGWDRELRDEAAWLANLDKAGIEYLVVTRADPREGPYDVHDAARFPIERTWADRHPERFRLIYGAADPIFRVYRIVRPQEATNS